VNIGAIIIIVIATSGVLMMRFRKRWLAKINIAFTNRITGLFAGWLPGFGILTHVGRKSGKVYRTPINVFRLSNGFIVALTVSIATTEGDNGSRDLLVQLLKDEEEHVDFLEAQVHQIKELGYERYLTMQMGDTEEET
jgi:Ferritin-like domain